MTVGAGGERAAAPQARTAGQIPARSAVAAQIGWVGLRRGWYQRIFADPLAIALYLAGVAFNLALAGICIIKGKLATGLIGILVPVLALVGAIRLAKPFSVWARRRYTGAKLGRAQRRFGPAYQLRRDRLRDLLGGRPDPAGGGDPAD